MALPESISSREFQKFVEDSFEKVCVRVLLSADSLQQMGLYQGEILPGSVNSVLPGIETTLITKTITAGATGYVGTINATGSADGIYILKIDNVKVAERRTAWTERNACFDYKFLKLSQGQVITLTVTHSEALAQDYSCDLLFIEVQS